MPTRELHQLVLTKGGSHQSFHGSRLLVPLTSDSCLARLVSGARAVARVAAAHAGRVAVIRLAWPGGSPVPRRGSRTPLCVKLPGGVVGRPGSGDPGWPWRPGAIRPPPSAMAQIAERSHAGVHDLRRTVSSPAEGLVRKRCAGQLAMAGSAVTDDRAGDSEGGPTRPRSCWSHCRPPRSRGRPERQRSGTGTSRCPC